MSEVTVVYQLSTNLAMCRDEAKRELVSAFLTAHGIDPMRFIVGTALYVRRHEDGTLWLHTWQAREGLPPCEHCEFCLKSDPVVVPLTEPAPALPEAFVAEQPMDDANQTQLTWATGPVDDVLIGCIRNLVQAKYGGPEGTTSHG